MPMKIGKRTLACQRAVADVLLVGYMPVLLALHATTRPLTGRRLATLAGASHTAVNAILSRLTRAGLVLAERQGSAMLYRANRDHVGWAVVEALAGMRRSTLEAMRTEIAS